MCSKNIDRCSTCSLLLLALLYFHLLSASFPLTREVGIWKRSNGTLVQSTDQYTEVINRSASMTSSTLPLCNERHSQSVTAWSKKGLLEVFSWIYVYYRATNVIDGVTMLNYDSIDRQVST